MSNNKYQQYFDFLFRPKKLQLIIFGILVTPVIMLGLYGISFSWMLSFELLLIPVYVVALVVLIATIYLDARFKMGLKLYTLIAVTLLIIYTFLSYPARNWLISQSEKQGEQIVKVIDEYKLENGHYPESLNVDYFKDIPRRSYVGSRFRYKKDFDEKNGIETFCIKYDSFYGYIGNYYSDRRNWDYSD